MEKKKDMTKLEIRNIKENPPMTETNNFKTKQQHIIESLIEQGKDPKRLKCRQCQNPFQGSNDLKGCQCFIDEKWIDWNKTKPTDLTDDDIKQLLTTFKVKEKLKKLMSQIGVLNNLVVRLRVNIKEFEKGNHLDREKLGQDINELRKQKHELRQSLMLIKFGKFQQFLTGETDVYFVQNNFGEKKDRMIYNWKTNKMEPE